MKKIILSIIFLSFVFSIAITNAQEYKHISQGAGPNPASPGAGPDPEVEAKPPAKNTDKKFIKLQNPLRVDSIEKAILLIVDITIYIGVSLAILVIIFIGFKFVMAQGNPIKLKEAREWFLWTIIGLAVLISAKVIVVIVENTLIDSGVVKEGFLK